MFQGIQKALMLAPHPDDGEFSSGGTLKKLIEEGVEVFYVAFSPVLRVSLKVLIRMFYIQN